ncbi:MAG: ASCH domain-containing protein [Bifidobacterium crudilactis]|jgi:predicted transcriptional regulator|nr:ASCH domain-containing protein [Bifidobacterium crudilactis]
MKAMLSIKPEYVSQILDGSKTYEFRRRIFKRTDVDTIIIYCTSPRSAVVAEAQIEDIIVDSPICVWKRTHKHGGISRDKFMEYFHDTDTAYAIKFKQITAFDEPMELKQYSPTVKAAPQSFVYIEA